jgi:hypothetical protein
VTSVGANSDAGLGPEPPSAVPRPEAPKDPSWDGISWTRGPRPGAASLEPDVAPADARNAQSVAAGQNPGARATPGTRRSPSPKTSSRRCSTERPAASASGAHAAGPRAPQSTARNLPAGSGRLASGTGGPGPATPKAPATATVMAWVATGARRLASGTAWPRPASSWRAAGTQCGASSQASAGLARRPDWNKCRHHHRVTWPSASQSDARQTSTSAQSANITAVAVGGTGPATGRAAPAIVWSSAVRMPRCHAAATGPVTSARRTRGAGSHSFCTTSTPDGPRRSLTRCAEATCTLIRAADTCGWSSRVRTRSLPTTVAGLTTRTAS